MAPLRRFFFALLLGACAALDAAPLPIGPARVEVANGTEPITLFTYKPPTYKGGPLFVVFHGVQRNAEDYRNFAITLAERFGAIVVAPHFDAERFPSARYQRGGLVGADGKPR
jgi:poly(3-hydroxybutyrate) depolymerase